MREKPWAAVPLLDPDKATLWFETDLDAHKAVDGKGYTIQYRPGRKPKPKPKTIKS